MNYDEVTEDFKKKLSADVASTLIRNMDAFKSYSEDSRFRVEMTVTAAMVLADAALTLMLKLEANLKVPDGSERIMMTSFIAKILERVEEMRSES